MALTDRLRSQRQLVVLARPIKMGVGLSSAQPESLVKVNKEGERVVQLTSE
jgi:hypothetical protein